MINLLVHDAAAKAIKVEMIGKHYEVTYYIDDDGYKCLLHNDGFCAGTSDLTSDYPDNDDYQSDDELNVILGSL